MLNLTNMVDTAGNARTGTPWYSTSSPHRKPKRLRPTLSSVQTCGSALGLVDESLYAHGSIEANPDNTVTVPRQLVRQFDPVAGNPWIGWQITDRRAFAERFAVELGRKLNSRCSTTTSLSPFARPQA